MTQGTSVGGTVSAGSTSSVATDTGSSTSTQSSTSEASTGSLGSEEDASDAETTGGAESSNETTAWHAETSAGSDADGTNETTGGIRPLPTISSVDVSVDGVTVSLMVASEDGTIAAAEIDWGENGTYESFLTDPPYHHDYAIPAEYQISIRIIDAYGMRSEVIQETVTSRVPSGAIAYFTMNGTTEDERGGDVTVDGLVEYDTDRFGLGERALSLDAGNTSGSGVMISMPAPRVVDAFSLSVWVELDHGCGICGNDVRIAGFGHWFSLFSPGADTRFGRLDGLRSADPALDAVIDETLPVGEPAWHHLVGILEPTTPALYTLRIYLDGASMAETQVSGIVPTQPSCRFYLGTFGSNDLCTGTEGPESQNFQGDLDDVRLYDRALSEVEVQALYHEGEYDGS